MAPPRTSTARWTRPHGAARAWGRTSRPTAGFTMFALNQGEVCTCPSRALIQSSTYDQFLGDAVERTKAVK